MKGYVSCHNRTYKLCDIKQLVEKPVNSTTVYKWLRCVESSIEATVTRHTTCNVFGNIDIITVLTFIYIVTDICASCLYCFCRHDAALVDTDVYKRQDSYLYPREPYYFLD